MQTYEKFMEMLIDSAWSQSLRGRYDVLERESQALSRKFEFFLKKLEGRWVCGDGISLLIDDLVR